jgi:hypothetical protein
MLINIIMLITKLRLISEHYNHLTYHKFAEMFAVL